MLIAFSTASREAAFPKTIAQLMNEDAIPGMPS